MGGKSKSSTGISLIDSAVDAGVGAVQGAASNIEQNVKGQIADLSLISKGNFNNYGQYLGRTALRIGTMGVINPNDASNITGDTMSERKAKEAIAAEADVAAQDAANVAAEKSRQITSTISGVVGAAQRSPGRTQTLLRNSPAGSNTLLTITGNR